VRKVLHHIREEYETAANISHDRMSAGRFTIANFVLMGQPSKQSAATKGTTDEESSIKEPSIPDSEGFAQSLKPVLMEAIQDVVDELETVYDNISKTAKDHIHSECDPNCSILFLCRSHHFPQ